MDYHVCIHTQSCVVLNSWMISDYKDFLLKEKLWGSSNYDLSSLLTGIPFLEHCVYLAQLLPSELAKVLGQTSNRSPFGQELDINFFKAFHNKLTKQPWMFSDFPSVLSLCLGLAPSYPS